MAHRRGHGGRIVFFGGLFSAVLVIACFVAEPLPLVPWFALVPMLFSLDRHRDSVKNRLLHAFAFGYVVCIWTLLPLSRLHAGAAVDGNGWLAGSQAALQAFGVWTLLSFSWAAFAWLGGPLLRTTSLWTPLLGLPALWTAIEYVRIDWLPSDLHWLSLAAALDPATPEAQVASVLGACGLSFVVVLVNTAFFMVLRQPTWARQFLLAGIGCAVFLVAHLSGSRAAAPDDLDSKRVALVQRLEDAAESSLKLAGSVVRPGTDLVVVVESRRTAAVEDTDWRTFALEAQIDVLAHLATPDASGKNARWITVGGRGGLPLARVEPSVPVPSSPETDSEAGTLWKSAAGTIGTLTDEHLRRSVVTRRLVDAGAEILLVVGQERLSGPPSFQRLRRRLLALRAVESRRWLLRASHGDQVALISPGGRTVAEAPPDISWAGVEDVVPSTARGPFTAWGWLCGPTAAALAAALVALRKLSERNRSSRA